jgi:DNA-binding ferritin-like protein
MVKARMVVVLHKHTADRTRALHTQVHKVMVLNLMFKDNHKAIRITGASMTKVHHLTSRLTEVVQVSSMELAHRVNTRHTHPLSNTHHHRSKAAMDSKEDKAKAKVGIASTAVKASTHPKARAMDNDPSSMAIHRTASRRKAMADRDLTAVAVVAEHRSLAGSVHECRDLYMRWWIWSICRSWDKNLM